METMPSGQTLDSLESPAGSPEVHAKTRYLLEAPILPTLLRLAWPNVLVMFAQASTGLIEMWFVAKLGTDALAGMALVLPVLILMQNMSQGAMGGGISAAISRALGAGNRAKADEFVLHALVINVALGVFFSVLVLSAGPALYRFLGGEAGSLNAALAYSSVLFAGITFLWVFTALGSIIRATGNMFVPGLVFCGGAVLLIPLSPCLIFGVGLFPAMGIAGGAVALLVYYLAGIAVLGWYVLSGRNLARFRWVPLKWSLLREILAIGSLASVNSIQLNVVIAGTMALVASHSGPNAVAGFGIGTRLEYLLPPIAFGLGAPMVALVGTNIGAGQNRRALHVALIGGCVAFGITELIGVMVAIWPSVWISQFAQDPQTVRIATAYLRSIGPLFGLLGLGLSLYFASQGAGRLGWPLIAGLIRVILALGIGWITVKAGLSLSWLYAGYGLGVFCYGSIIAGSVAAKTWFRPSLFRRAST